MRKLFSVQKKNCISFFWALYSDWITASSCTMIPLYRRICVTKIQNTTPTVMGFQSTIKKKMRVNYERDLNNLWVFWVFCQWDIGVFNKIKTPSRWVLFLSKKNMNSKIPSRGGFFSFTKIMSQKIPSREGFFVS